MQKPTLPDSEDKKESNDSAEELLEQIRSRFKLSAEATAKIRKEALDDIEFSVGNQWPAEIKQARALDNRPCLTVNVLPQSIRQVTNDQRQNRPSIKVDPVDDNADMETARIKQGVIRHIEYNSNADVAYDGATDGAVRKGFGYFRILTDFCDPLSFEQELLIKKIHNDFKVYFDPSSREPDGSDAEWCIIIDDLTPEEYKSQYPDSEMASMTDFSSLGDQAPDWMPGGRIRIAEYLYKSYTETKLHMLANGTVVQDKDLPKPLPEGIKIKQTRTTKIPVVKWAKVNAVEIIEQNDTVFDKWIPVVPVYGEEVDVDGERILCGIVRYAKDPQRMRNYWKSAETEAIALAPRAPFIGYEGQFEGHEAQWKTANTKNHAFLQVKPITIGGTPASLPQRQSFEPAVAAITNASREASEDIKATTGIYDASLGNRSNENSGVAIQRRNQQSQTANFHFVDNLARSLRHTGRILVRAIPKVYDTARSIRIIGEDGQQEIVKVNQVHQKDGKDVAYNLDAGQYDVTVDTGPSYQTKRQEAAASMVDLSKVNPMVNQLAGDLIVRNMDWPGAQEMADRLKKGLPPGVAEEKGQGDLDPAVKQKMDQAQQMIDQLTKELNAAHDAMEGKKLELESKERIAAMDNNVKLEIALATLGSKDAQAMLAHQISEIQHRLDLIHYNAPIGGEEPQPEMAPQQDPSMGQPAMADPSQMPTDGLSPGVPLEQQ